MVAASDRGWAAMETATMPRFYLDLRRHRDLLGKGETPWTPAVAVAFQVDEGLRLMAEETPAGIFARHEICAAATQAGLEALGFRLFADPAHRSRTVTAAWIPEDLEWKAFNGELKRRDLILAGGQGKLAGKVFRVGHLGMVRLDEILAAIGTIEEVLAEEGRLPSAGVGVAAAERAAIELEQGRQAVGSAATAGAPATAGGAR
jgi:aspartate aminotransferase-like enzyme